VGEGIEKTKKAGKESGEDGGGLCANGGGNWRAAVVIFRTGAPRGDVNFEGKQRGESDWAKIDPAAFSNRA